MQRPETTRADDAALMCAWCETRVQGACKSHYDTMTCTHRVIVPTAEEWDSATEARAAELNEGCRMQMEQARQTAEYWKAEHLAGNVRIGELHDELAETASRAADHLRKAIKAEAEVALLRAALSQVLDVVSLPREPNWAYRNTITTNKDRIKAACRSGLGLD